MELDLCAPCLFGLEGPLKNEIAHLGCKNVRAENGRVRFRGTEADAARVNLRSRFGERVLIELARGQAASFEELFRLAETAPWEAFIPQNGVFPVKGYALNSALHSVPDCQKIVKKAVSRRLGKRYGLTWLPEDGALYQIQFAILNDEAALYLDTTGTGLHKRGYRPAQVAAPLRETLAAAMVDIAGYRGKGDFCDPFCGSGTIAIEAALAAKRRAPGLKRQFAAERWPAFPAAVWRDAREEAVLAEFSGTYHIFASDVDPKAVAIAKANAARAGVDDIIRFAVADACAFDRRTERGVIVTNPPYGERLLDRPQAAALMRRFGEAVRPLAGWSQYILSADEEFERAYGRRADKVRKLYNGMIKCGLYIYK